jgi:hypothetical protein
VKRDFQHILKKQKFEDKLLSKGRTNMNEMKYARFTDGQQKGKTPQSEHSFQLTSLWWLCGVCWCSYETLHA